jgi:hypothetical protein
VQNVVVKLKHLKWVMVELLLKKVLAKAPVNMYGIPQENLGTSGQFGFARKGGSVKRTMIKKK